jgi:hypothetical protein
LRYFSEYREIADLIVAACGKARLVDDLAADDLEALRATMAERRRPMRLGSAITRVKSVFKYGFDNRLGSTPLRSGGEFRKPDKAVLRAHRAQSGAMILEADEPHRLIDAQKLKPESSL